METDGASAAERAELRRKRILAKRSARMAYAAGDRSVVPRAAPEEEVPIIPRRHDSVLSDFRNPVVQSSQSMNGDEVAPSSRESLAAAPPESFQDDPSLQNSTNFKLQVDPVRALTFRTSTVRYCVLIATAALLALWVTTVGSSRRPFSAVLVFGQVELLLNSSLVYSALSRSLFAPQVLLRRSIFQWLSLASAAVAALKKLYDDAIVFAFFFLILMRFMESNS